MAVNFPYHCSIRKILSNNPIDFDRIRIIDRDPHVLCWMAGIPISDEELLDFITDKHDYFIYGISGLKGYVDQTEVDQLQGWITFRSVASEQLKMLSLAHLSIPENVWEISYAKYPPAKPGQISDGIGLAITEFLTYHQSSSIIAFTDPKNIASEIVIQKNNFINIGLAHYDSDSLTLDHVWIFKLL
ncbi:MAG: hypothetical protein NTY75_05040 [Candidatus Shapirobacteria bacterium]|nr:hypothetical protein [Candidatus Shapirobacteria bacterium]